MSGNVFGTYNDLHVVDPIATQIVHGYGQAEGIAQFLAPAVNVSTRSGLVLKFSKENFATLDLHRAPRSLVQRVSSEFGNRDDADRFNIRQLAVGSEVPREMYEEAINGPARIDLRRRSILRAAAAINQAWEAKAIAAAYDTTKYETSNLITVAGAVASYDTLIQDTAEIIRTQVGVYPNSAIVSPDVWLKIRQSAEYKDRLKYTSIGSVNTAATAAWWDCTRGVRIAKRQKLDNAGNLVSMVPAGSILLFYSPEGSVGEGLMPVDSADYGTPASFYTYSLNGYPVAEPERYDEDRKTYITDIMMEMELQVVGLGNTGKLGAAALITGIA